MSLTHHHIWSFSAYACHTRVYSHFELFTRSSQADPPAHGFPSNTPAGGPLSPSHPHPYGDPVAAPHASLNATFQRTLSPYQISELRALDPVSIRQLGRAYQGGGFEHSRQCSKRVTWTRKTYTDQNGREFHELVMNASNLPKFPDREKTPTSSALPNLNTVGFALSILDKCQIERGAWTRDDMNVYNSHINDWILQLPFDATQEEQISSIEEFDFCVRSACARGEAAYNSPHTYAHHGMRIMAALQMTINTRKMREEQKKFQPRFNKNNGKGGGKGGKGGKGQRQELGFCKNFAKHGVCYLVYSGKGTADECKYKDSHKCNKCGSTAHGTEQHRD